MKTTKAKKSAADADTMRPEYDFSNAVRGVTAARYAQGTNVVLQAELRQPLTIDGNTYPHSYLARIAC